MLILGNFFMILNFYFAVESVSGVYSCFSATFSIGLIISALLNICGYPNFPWQKGTFAGGIFFSLKLLLMVLETEPPVFQPPAQLDSLVLHCWIFAATQIFPDKKGTFAGEKILTKIVVGGSGDRTSCFSATCSIGLISGYYWPISSSIIHRKIYVMLLPEYLSKVIANIGTKVTGLCRIATKSISDGRIESSSIWWVFSFI